VAGGLLGGTNDFYRVGGEARAFRALPLGAVLAVRGMVGFTFPYGRTQLAPYYEVFAIGGRNCLRGYPDRSLGPDDAPHGGKYGPVIGNASFELRGPYFLNWVAVVAFTDCGEVVGRSGFSLSKLEYSAGGGIRVRTPIGPVRLDWGKRLKAPPAGDMGRVYFGILHAF
jgi:outer membrane protein assembly factor BamA